MCRQVNRWPAKQTGGGPAKQPAAAIFFGGGGQGCIRREGPSEAAPEAARQAVGGGGCQSGWGRLLSVTNATEAGTCRPERQWLGIGWAPWKGGGGVPPPLPIHPWGRGSRPWQAGEAPSPDGTRESSRNQGSELSDAAIVPQGDGVADITRRENELILMQEMQREPPRPSASQCATGAQERPKAEEIVVGQPTNRQSVGRANRPAAWQIVHWQCAASLVLVVVLLFCCHHSGAAVAPQLQSSDQSRPV